MRKGAFGATSKGRKIQKWSFGATSTVSLREKEGLEVPLKVEKSKKEALEIPPWLPFEKRWVWRYLHYNIFKKNGYFYLPFIMLVRALDEVILNYCLLTSKTLGYD